MFGINTINTINTDTINTDQYDLDRTNQTWPQMKQIK